MKNKIRKEILEIRRNLSEEYVSETSRKITDKILDLPEYKNADLIFCYIAAKNEVQTNLLIEDAWKCGKRMAVPKVHGKEMSFYEIHSFNQLKTGNFGIKEPDDSCPLIEKPNDSSIVIMPGVAFDRTGNRIGYGGGYYDRYFQKYPEIYKIAPAYDFQIVPSIEAEEHDIKVDKITFIE